MHAQCSKKSNVDVVLGKFGHLGMIHIFRWTKEIFLLILTSVYLCNWASSGLYQSVCPYKLVKNCDLYGNVNGTHAIDRTGDKICAEGTFNRLGGMQWGRLNACYRFALGLGVETFLKGQTGRKNRVTKVNCVMIFMTVLFIACVDGPPAYIWNLHPL